MNLRGSKPPSVSNRNFT